MDSTPETPRAWRIHSSTTGHVEIASREGKYLLVLEPCDGQRWEADATAAVTEAAEHLFATFLDELYLRILSAEQEAQERVQTRDELLDAIATHIKRQENDLEFAREMLQRAADGGFLG